MLQENIKATDKKTKFEYDVVAIFYENWKPKDIRCDFEENEWGVFEFKVDELDFIIKK
jgi:hypothetical protein